MKQQMKVQLPEKLADIPVRRYGNLRKYDIDEKSSEEFVALKVLECFYDIPNDQANNIDASNSNFMVSQINNLLALKPELVQKFELGGVEYGLIPNINAISFGELVDLKSLGEKDYAKLLAILYRPITEKSGDRYLVADYEGYDKVDFNTGKSPENIMSEAPLDALFGVFTFFFDLVERYDELYPELYEGVVEENASKANAKQSFAKKWGWYVSIAVLSGDNVHRFTDTYRLQAHTALKFLSYKSDEDILTRKILK